MNTCFSQEFMCLCLSMKFDFIHCLIELQGCCFKPRSDCSPLNRNSQNKVHLMAMSFGYILSLVSLVLAGQVDKLGISCHTSTAKSFNHHYGAGHSSLIAWVTIA